MNSIFRTNFQTSSKLCKSWGGLFDLDNAEKDLELLDQKCENPLLWDDPSAAEKILKKRALCKNTVDQFYVHQASYNELKELYPLALEEADTSILTEIQENLLLLKSWFYQQMI